ncbi:MAG: PH domain-containing protein [Alphaproteobacteria bacterium]|nr:PH domain-containing protein [Alphaproteobacteria bacterium]MDE2162695.1 PH domain-containing protein [Alphaproteobacteria bacterium]MDE2265107.1 PH domain-containing protein [Alphaproteobacteria bacterium]MDE2499603.1 PH domain-containing protein [Alphaproteobacteria bacterium]
MNFSLKPVFVGWITLLAQLPLQLFLTFWAAAFFGGITSALLQNFGEDFEPETFFTGTPFAFFGALAFFGVPFIAYVGKRLNYSHTEYRFFDDHLELEEGFFSINKKVVRYSDVKEITLHKGFLQRSCGLGTVYLATLATGSSPESNSFRAFGFGNISASGVSIRDIREPDTEYGKIRRVVNPRS